MPNSNPATQANLFNSNISLLPTLPDYSSNHKVPEFFGGRGIINVREYYQSNLEISTQLVPLILQIWHFDSFDKDISTTLSPINILSKKAGHQFETVMQRQENDGFSFLDQANLELLDTKLTPTNFLKSATSMQNKTRITGQSVESFKDTCRFTCVFENSIPNYEYLEKLMQRIMKESLGNNIFLEDFKIKVKTNGYSDITLYFGYYAIISNILYRKPIEAQLQSRKVMNIKKSETPLYDQAKEICIKLHKILGKSFDVDHIYDFMRFLLDNGVINETNIVKQDDFEKETKQFLKNKGIEEQNISKFSKFLLVQFDMARKIFCTSFDLYKEAGNVIDRGSKIKMVNYLQNILEEHKIAIDSILSKPTISELNPEAQHYLYTNNIV